MKNESIIGYMDKVDFDYELGNNKRGNTVYPSIESLKEAKPCTTECGIIEVEIKLRSIVKDTDFGKHGGYRPKKRKGD
jgi:hypothetical protein